MQIATDTDMAIIDAVAIGDLSPLFPLLWICGAGGPPGGQDLGIMALLMGELRGVVGHAGGVLGYGLQIGSVLLDRVQRSASARQTYTD